MLFGVTYVECQYRRKTTNTVSELYYCRMTPKDITLVNLLSPEVGPGVIVMVTRWSTLRSRMSSWVSNLFQLVFLTMGTETDGK